MKRSLTNHLQVGTRIFAARQFGKGIAAGYDFGLLVHENRTQHQHTMKTYGEVFVQVTRETF